MISIIIAIVALAMMAKGRGKRRYGKYLRGAVDVLGDLSTLAALTVINFTMTGAPTVNERTWVSSVKASWTLSNLTEGFSMGPIVCGIAHSDYSVGEILGYLNNDGNWNEGDLVAQETSKRKIRQVGVFDTPAQALGISMLNDGRMITTKCGWILNQGQTLNFWCYNSGSNALATTAAELAVQGHANLWPR